MEVGELIFCMVMALFPWFSFVALRLMWMERDLKFPSIPFASMPLWVIGIIAPIMVIYQTLAGS